MVYLASLGVLGLQVVMAVMVVTEPKVNRAALGRLDSRDLPELLVSMETMASKGSLVSRALPANRGSAEIMGQMELLVSMEKMALKENLEHRDLPVIRGNAGRMEQVGSLGA